jgi:2-amino-4-hydroxy-6-hydroxymethyldihydropteridine diphosphokinase
VATALIGMGSNINPIEHLQSAANEIRAKFPCVKFSQVYQSKAVGMDGDDFLNACCLLTDVHEKQTLLRWLKALEDKHKRDRSKGSWKPRTLDLDILVYNGEIVDQQAFDYAHVFVPASELVALGVPEKKTSELTLIPLCL